MVTLVELKEEELRVLFNYWLEDLVLLVCQVV